MRIHRFLPPMLLLAALAFVPWPPQGPEEASAEEGTGGLVLERITNAVPWPRGVRYVDGTLYALARGVHRSAGGPNPDIQDMAGTLFRVDPNVSEPVVKGEAPGDAVSTNGSVYAAASAPPFFLWDRRLPSTLDRRAQRPYCTLVYDEPSQNLFICGFSGIDLPKPHKFRKNSTDCVLRYDMNLERWLTVDVHNPLHVPEAEHKKVIDPKYYPHHDITKNPPPHGMINGACGAAIAGRYLYVGAKDNTALVQYDLDGIRKNPLAGAPPARFIFHRPSFEKNVFVQVKGHGNTYVEGTCAIGVHEGYLYVCFRTTSQILRFPLDGDGNVKQPLEAEYIAQFSRYTPKKGGSANIYDIDFDSKGWLYVSPGYDGAVYRFKPEAGKVHDFTKGYNKPYIDLTELVGAKKSGNICFDPDDNLYICAGHKELPNSNIRGAIYRVRSK